MHPSTTQRLHHQSHQAEKKKLWHRASHDSAFKVSDFHITVQAHSATAPSFPGPLPLSGFIYVAEVGTAKGHSWPLLLIRKWPVPAFQEDPQSTLLPLLGWDRTLVAHVSELFNHESDRHIQVKRNTPWAVKLNLKEKGSHPACSISQTDFLEGDLNVYVCICVCLIAQSLI